MTKVPEPLMTHSRLVHDLRQLGLRPGQMVMLHSSVKAIGWVVGGPDVVLQALLDVLTPAGTLVTYVGWECSSYELADSPEQVRQRAMEEWPPFDPATSRARRKWSILTEYLRSRPGACRSEHPDASFAAAGAQAHWLTEGHPLQYGCGPGSPLAKLCEAGGQVLLLGAPLDAITLLHHAEHLADIPDKRVARYRAPILCDGRRVWVDIEQFDTTGQMVDWEGPEEYFFAAIAREFLESGRGRTGKVGAAKSYLFDAAALTRFGIEWLERRYGKRR